MVDEEEQFEDGESRERMVEEVAVTESALLQRIVVPRTWGSPTLLGSAERGALLLYAFAEMPHLLCWRLPEDADVIVEVLPDSDPRAQAPIEPADEEIAEIGVWVLPDDIDEERLRYPARWGRPAPILDAWVDGGPILLAFADGEHTLRWELAEDILLSLIADDSL
jgi:hypothetical protein